MTRINTIPPEQLTDQHLFAEFREITRVSSLARPLSEKEQVADYTMGTGHVKFFYDKGLFLAKRLEQLQAELDKRGNINYTVKDYKPHAEGLNNDWEPDKKAHITNLIRLDSKIREQPKFYRYYSKPVQTDFYLTLIMKTRSK
jgi:deoxyribonuclease (pyrimidine dimer)